MVCLLATLSVSVFAQNITVKGTVVDASNGEGVVGAAVVVKGQANSYAVTDAAGAFSLSVAKDAILVASSLGYKTLEVNVEGRRSLTIELDPDTESLDEVVITAQGLTRKQKAIGYSAQVLNEETLTMTHSSDLGNSLAGKVAGATFWGAGGSTFNEGAIVLRGATSYTSAVGSAPIYVIDGVIATSAAVNMDDVASINILKGPAATALYGSRGANGAVIVSTKKAEEGRSVIEFSHTSALESYYNHVELNTLYGGGSLAANVSSWAAAEGADAHDYTSAPYLFEKAGYKLADGTYTMDYWNDENWGPRYDGTTMVHPALSFDPTSSKAGVAETWESRLKLSDLTRVAWTNTTNVAFSKSVKGMNTRVAFTNVDRPGVVYNAKAVRRSFSIASSFKPAAWLTADVSYRYRLRQNQNASTEGYGELGNFVYDFTQWGQTNVNIADYKDYLTPEGQWRTWNITSTSDLTPKYHSNPYGTMYNFNITSTHKYHILAGDVYATLPHNIKVGARLNNYIDVMLWERKQGTGSSDFESSFDTNQTQSNDFTAQAYATYSGQFVQDKLSLEAAVFAEQRQYDYYDLESYTNGGLSVPNYYNLAGSSTTYTTTNSETHFMTRSFFGTATAGWNDVLYLDGSLRYDLDSRLPSDNNGYLYGGASVSYMASNVIKLPWLNFWKLRGSVAQVGSTIGAYNILTTYTVGAKVHNFPAMYEPATLKNENIQPTISTSYEVGTEFKLFDNRLWGDINIYRKDTKNDIIQANVLPQAGYYYRLINAGLVRNQGVEVVLGASVIRTKNLDWSVSANVAKNNNLLVELAPGQKEYTIYWSGFYDRFYLEAREGQPIGVIATGSRFKTDENGKMILAPATSAAWGEVMPQFERDTKKDVGNVQPILTGGFSTNLRYKDLTLGASLDFVLGGQIVSWTNMWGEGSGVFASTAKLNPKGVNEREPVAAGGGVYLEGVDKDGNPISGYCDAYRYYHNKAYYATQEWVYDRTYLKLREVSLKYDIPKKKVQNLGIGLSSASVALVATNPWLIYSAVPNLDPSEIVGTEYGYLEGGQAMSTRSVGITVNATF